MTAPGMERPEVGAEASSEAPSSLPWPRDPRSFAQGRRLYRQAREKLLYGGGEMTNLEILETLRETKAWQELFPALDDHLPLVEAFMDGDRR